MDEKMIGIIGVVIAILFLVTTYLSWSNLEQNKILLANDSQFAQYINANSQAMKYLTEDCKVVKDSNESTSWLCIKRTENN